MPVLGDYIPAACQGPIGNHIPGGWAAFPVNTPLVARDNVASPVTKIAGGTIQIYLPAGWLANPTDEGRDTLIFEGINVINMARLNAARANFETNRQTLTEYGRAYSDIEAETTWSTGYILNDMAAASIALSEWGRRLRDDVVSPAYPNLQTYRHHFANTPQDPSAADQRRLKSKQLYRFEWVSRAGQQVITRKIRDYWLIDQMAKLSRTGANSPYDRMSKAIDSLIGGMTQYGAGTLGRVEVYNRALATLANDTRLSPPAGFLNTKPYLCPMH